MRVARVWRTSVLAVAALLAGQLAPMSVAHAIVTYPYAAVDSPANNAAVFGTTAIAVEGHTDPLGAGTDDVVSLTLIIDTVPVPGVAGTIDCTTGQISTTDCAGTFHYDFSTLPAGPHSIVVELASTVSLPADSPPVEVTETAIGAPTVTIATPHPTSPATGVVSVTATGTVDPNDTDNPGTLQLRVDGTLVGTKFTCPAGKTCGPEALSLDTEPFPDGTHSISVVFLTTGGTKKISAPFSLTFSNPLPTVTITSPAAGATVSGSVTVTATGTSTLADNDFITSMKLFVSGIGTAVDTEMCGAAVTACGESLTWNATGVGDGNRTLKVELFTTKHSGGTISDSVAVHVKNPVPGVVITSPTPGMTVSGVVSVAVTGTVDAAQVDSAHTMALFATVGGTTTQVDSTTCSGHTCTGPLDWDASGVTGPATLKVVLTTTNGVVGSSSVNVTVVSAPPSSAVSAPAAGATVSGVVSVVTGGATSPTQNDAPQTIQLIIDGAAFGAGPLPCTAAAGTHTCSVPYTWDTTGMSGAHTLQTRFVTRLGTVVLSAVTTVTVVSPAPTAVITSPLAGSTVARAVTITVTGAVDPSQTDAPSSMAVTVDGKALGTAQPCTSVPTAPRTCQVSFSWNTVGITDKHVLVATLTTSNGAVGSSAASTVYVYGGTVVALPKVSTLRAGRTVTITGRANYIANKAGVPAVPVKILLVFANGKTRAFTVTTNVNGFYKVTFVPTMNTVVEATVVPLAYNGTSHTFTRLAVIPQPSCTLQGKLHLNAVGKGVCKLAGMPKGTKLKLQYEVKGKWYTLGNGKAPGTVVPFAYGFKVAGTYHVRLVFAASHVFVATIGPSLKVVVA